jgi:hypothetical protein
LLVYLEEKKWEAMSDEEKRASMARCAPHGDRLRREGKLIDGRPLHPTSTATTLRYRNGKPLLTDGPFAETREQLGGYSILEAANLDEAIEMAAGFLGETDWVTLELRPIVDMPQPGETVTTEATAASR